MSLSAIKRDAETFEEFLLNIRKKIIAYCKKKKIEYKNRYARNQAAFEWIENFYYDEYNNYLKQKNI